MAGKQTHKNHSKETKKDDMETKQLIHTMLTHNKATVRATIVIAAATIFGVLINGGILAYNWKQIGLLNEEYSHTYRPFVGITDSTISGVKDSDQSMLLQINFRMKNVGRIPADDVTWRITKWTTDKIMLKEEYQEMTNNWFNNEPIMLNSEKTIKSWDTGLMFPENETVPYDIFYKTDIKLKPNEQPTTDMINSVYQTLLQKTIVIEIYIRYYNNKTHNTYFYRSLLKLNPISQLFELQKSDGN